LVDTNVVIGLLLYTDPNNKTISDIVQALENIGAVLVLTPPIIRELFKFFVSDSCPITVSLDFLRELHARTCKYFKIVQLQNDETAKYIDIIFDTAKQQKKSRQ